MLQSTVGYTAGHDTEPTYESVCSGRTGHTEAVQASNNDHNNDNNDTATTNTN